VKRREFLAVSAVSAMTVQGGGRGQTNFAPMDGGFRPVVKPPKPNAVPLLSDAQRDALEHRLKCMCGGCSLNIYTCRTTDFTCGFSPQMHRDVQGLIAGGYTADEIVDAFVEVYGERVLTAPKPEGFNIAGYVVPFIAMAAGATGVTLLLRRWTRAAAVAAAAAPVAPAVAAGVQATPDELARVAAAVRDEESDDA
jgi:cytochrome c-type biogenesis protein CcmH